MGGYSAPAKNWEVAEIDVPVSTFTDLGKHKV